MKRALVTLTAVLFLMGVAGSALVACSGSESVTINSPADFEGAKVAVQDETTADISIQEMINAGMNIEVIRFPQVINCFDDLEAGRVDAVYTDSVVAAYYTTGSDVFDQVWLSDEAEPLGICLSKGSENLRDVICAVVDMLYYNGTMAEIGRRHFGDDFGAVRNVTSQPVIPSLADGDLMTPGTLTIGVEIGYPPMEYFDTDGVTPIGFDIDVGKAIAEYLGLECVFIDTAWDGIFAGVDRGDYDCIISSVSITPEREQVFIFTKPYVGNALCIVVKN